MLLRTTVGIVAMCMSLAVQATVYSASKVVLNLCEKSGEDFDLKLLGETSDGHQIWACASPVSEYAKWMRWKVDDGKYISANVDVFNLNENYALSTSYKSTYRRLGMADTAYMHFLKLNSATSADFFISDGEHKPEFISQYQLSPQVTITVDSLEVDKTKTKRYRGTSAPDDIIFSNFRRAVHWKITGITVEAIQQVVVERSYDKGKTWEEMGYGDTLEGVSDSALSVTEETVRFRAVVYPKSHYKPVMDKEYWVSDNSQDYNIEWYNRVSNPGKRIIMNTGEGGGHDIEMYKIGVTPWGREVWTCNNTTGGVAYTNWRISTYSHPDFIKMSYNVPDFYTDLEYDIDDTNYISGTLRYIPAGPDVWHFIILNYNIPPGKYSGDLEYHHYINTRGSEQFNPVHLAIMARQKMEMEKPSITPTTATQNLKWRMYGASNKMLDSLVVEQSVDSAKTWTAIQTLKSFDESKFECEGSVTATFPVSCGAVRYRISGYPKYHFGPFVQNRVWRTEFVYDLSKEFSNCEIKVQEDHEVSKDKFTDDEDPAKRTFETRIYTFAYDGYDGYFGHADLQYSVDGGKTWNDLATTPHHIDYTTVKVPAGYTEYLFRVKAYPKDDYSYFAGLYKTAVTDEPQRVSYSPAISELAVAGEPEPVANYNDIATIPVHYALNDDLYQIRSKATISFSYDEGLSWHKLKSFAPKKEDTVNINVDTANYQNCKFRISVQGIVNGKTSTYTKETESTAIKNK